MMMLALLIIRASIIIIIIIIIIMIIIIIIIIITTIIIIIVISTINSTSITIMSMLMMSGKPKLAECKKGAIFASPRRRRALPPTCARENFACLGCRPGLLTPAARSAPRPRSTTLPMGKIGAA
ncbi:MAG: hypothetical protein QGH65_19180, partial [SAR324 cluster bacterium]|nr:hypothetical protein [SAR324 cluster bacterium]